MEQFKFINNVNSSFSTIEKLVNEGLRYGLDLQDILKKIDSVKSMIKDGIIRIVLLGSFSDGKTSAIAGLLGRLEDTMKIDQDESSDELKVYRPAGLKQGFEIVDTPGLFGTKEKELDGRNVKYSDITKKYLSEAHIVIYVCDAVTPLKDSHVPVIKWIMRDLNKLNSSIFVINKMDEAGYDLLDDIDYNRGNEIKRNALISRLRNAINLTPDEEHRLHVVCIAADPKGKGLTHWFAKPDDYMRRSHIGLLRDSLNDVVNNSDSATLGNNAIFASIKDMISSVSEEIEQVTTPLQRSLKKVDDSCKDLTFDVQQLKSELALNLNEMQIQLDQYRSGLYADIEGASVETIGEIVDRALGVQDGNVTFYVLLRNVDQIISSCSEANNASINSSLVKFEREFDAQDKFLTGALKGGAEYLKTVSVTGEQVKAIRDVIASSYKFKPWGAINLGKNITKGIGRFAVGINVAIEIYSLYKRWKDSKELDKTKNSIRKALDEFFAQVYKSFKEDGYYKNYAPSYLVMQKQLDERQTEVEKLRQKISELEKYKAKIDTWKNTGEYVEFTEVES